MMKVTLLILAMMLVTISFFAQVNGVINTIGDKRILHVWGNHYDRGYAQGYLLAEESMQVMYNYFFQMVTYSNVPAYNMLMSFMQARFSVDQKYLDEATGYLAGIQDAGISTFHQGLQRELTIEDILLGNAIVDMRSLRTEELGLPDIGLGCSSISSWGESTSVDSLLNGNIVITRLLDWDRDATLLANPILIVHHPSEADEQKWMSFTYPGLIGALSGISENGSAAFLNVGNANSYQYSTGLKHILFSVRNGLEKADFNDDGFHDGIDIYDSVYENRHLSGTLIHAISENGTDRVAGIIENNWWGTELRTIEHNGYQQGTNLHVTNHFRLLYNPVCCGRYEAIVDSLLLNPYVSSKRQWTMLAGAAGWQNNMMAIQFIPSLGNILWANADATSPAYETPAISLNATDLFLTPVSSEDYTLPSPQSRLFMYPHPFRSGKKLNLKADQPIHVIDIYNLKGQKLKSIINVNKSNSLQIQNELGGMSPGLYLLRVKHHNGTSNSRKLLISG